MECKLGIESSEAYLQLVWGLVGRTINSRSRVTELGGIVSVDWPALDNIAEARTPRVVSAGTRMAHISIRACVGETGGDVCINDSHRLRACVKIRTTWQGIHRSLRDILLLGRSNSGHRNVRTVKYILCTIRINRKI